MKLAVAFITTLLIGIFILFSAGNFFIEEVIQEVSVTEPASSTYQGFDDPGTATGKRVAPYWDLPDLEGNRVLLTDFSDKPLVLTFWTTWNTLAADQLVILDAIYAKGSNGEKGLNGDSGLFNIVAINSQEAKGKVFNFMSRGGYDLPVVLDELGQIGELYGLKQAPTTYFIDKNGVIAEVFVGILDEKSLVEKVENIIK